MNEMVNLFMAADTRHLQFKCYQPSFEMKRKAYLSNFTCVLQETSEDALCDHREACALLNTPEGPAMCCENMSRIACVSQEIPKDVKEDAFCDHSEELAITCS